MDACKRRLASRCDGEARARGLIAAADADDRNGGAAPARTGQCDWASGLPPRPVTPSGLPAQLVTKGCLVKKKIYSTCHIKSSDTCTEY